MSESNSVNTEAEGPKRFKVGNEIKLMGLAAFVVLSGLFYSSAMGVDVLSFKFVPFLPGTLFDALMVWFILTLLRVAIIVVVALDRD